MGPQDRRRKTGYQIRNSVVLAVRDAVNQGAAESQNAFVEQALIRALKELRRDRLYREYSDAAKDPLFQADMRSITQAFEPTARDGLEGDD